MKELHALPLTGLTGSNPLGALAAFGVLRLCRQMPELAGARLSWRLQDDWIAVIHTTEAVTGDAFAELLHTSLHHVPGEVFQWNDDIRVAPDDYRERLQALIHAAGVHGREHVDYFTAFGSETVVDGSKGLVKPTAFYMTSGQQKFLAIVNQIAENLKTEGTAPFREALFGPWLYQDQQHSLGWDPVTERMHALRHRAPTSETPRSVRAAVWLGFAALPLFPTMVIKGRLATTAYTRQSGQTAFTWPLWTAPIGLDTLRSLIGQTQNNGSADAYEKLSRRGVAAVYQSVRSEYSQGYGILRPATAIYCAA